MTKAKRSEGPRAPLFYSVLAFALGDLALAQSVDLADLEVCAGLETDVQKLACFEAIVATSGDAPQPVPQPPAEVQPEAESLAAAQPESEPRVDVEPDSMTDVQPEPAAEAPPGPPPAPPVAASTAVLRAVESRPDEGPPAVINATVVDVTKDGYGALIFHFDNGQVWGQQEKRYFSYPKNRQFDVTISEGIMGESRLQVEGAGRRLTIKRIQ